VLTAEAGLRFSAAPKRPVLRPGDGRYFTKQRFECPSSDFPWPPTGRARHPARFARDSPLEGDGFELVWGFPCQVVFFGLLPVLCSEREGAVLHPVAYDQVSGARAMGSRDRNTSKAWRLAEERDPSRRPGSRSRGDHQTLRAFRPASGSTPHGERRQPPNSPFCKQACSAAAISVRDRSHSSHCHGRIRRTRNAAAVELAPIIRRW
jgi:hypothetical protein